MENISRYKKIAAVITPVILLLCSFTIVISFTDIPIINTISTQNTEKNKRAAIAIRDDVIIFQKFGTKLFTIPYLEKCYGKVFYFTQYYEKDKEMGFKKALNEAILNYDYVDIFLLAHSNQYYKWVLDCNTEYFYKIRMVYNTGCSNIDQAEYWIDIGVTSYVSHKGNLSLSPIFYFYFLRRWTHGYSLDISVEESNFLTKKIIPLFYIFLDKEYCITDYQADTKAYIFGDEVLRIGSYSK